MPSGRFFKILDKVDSTNNYAMAQIHAGMANHGMAWFALEQNAGKGQRGKTWETEAGKNIALSLVLEPVQLSSSQQFYLSAAMALACFEFFFSLAGEGTSIKWPNDLYWRDRKAGGILIENVFHGSVWKYAIVGVGININQVNFESSLNNPVSLKQIKGSDFDNVALARQLYAQLLNSAEGVNSHSFGNIIAAYNQHLYGLNELIKLKKENMVFETRIKAVSAQGRLITLDATEREFDFGEVEWVR